MSEPNEKIARLLYLAESMNRKIDALTDCVTNIAQRLDAVEGHIFAQALAEPEVADKMEQITEELESLEEERVSHRQSANAVSASELAALFGGNQ